MTMKSTYSKHFSIVMSSIFVKCTGIWLASNKFEQRLRDITFSYTIFTIVFSVWVQTVDFYNSWGDFGTCTYIACNILCVNIALLKVFLVFAHKKRFLKLLVHMRKNFWESEYSLHEEEIYLPWKKMCTYFICIFTFFTGLSNISFIFKPIWVNMGRNESERILPFKIYLDLPLSMTPYFEIVFLLQTLALVHIGICYAGFDNFICLMNLHVAAQFQILNHRFKNSRAHDANIAETPKKGSHFCPEDELENVFRTVALAQVLTFSLMLCFVGFQATQANIPLSRRFTFVNLMVSNLCHLFMFTYSCNCLTEGSRNVASAVYSGPWLNMPMNENGRMLRKDMLFILMRTKRPCCLTANGFFAISLETYTSVFSTAMSYFTLLRQSSVNVKDS